MKAGNMFETGLGGELGQPVWEMEKDKHYYVTLKDLPELGILEGVLWLPEYRGMELWYKLTCPDFSEISVTESWLSNRPELFTKENFK
jgi:hypothetical protein